MIRLLLISVILGAIAPAIGADVTLALVPPDHPVRPGTTMTINLVALNPASEEVAFTAPRVLTGTLAFNAGTRSVELTANGTPPTSVPRGGFTYQSYRLAVPSDAIGDAILQVQIEGARTLFAVLKLDSSTAPDAPSDGLAPQHLGTSLYKRIVAGRIAPHNAIYFLYGGGDGPAAKFQLSLKYHLLTFGNAARRTRPTIQLGYTQRSLWDIEADSKPFYDTSYMPEVFVEWLDPADSRTMMKRLGWQAGYRHESNGRDGVASRSYNVVYARTIVSVGHPEGWHLTFNPEVWAFSGSHESSPNLERYRGDGLLRFRIGKGGGAWLMATARMGRSITSQTHQIDFSFPLRSRFFDFESFFVVQYFHGYGESLLTYDQKSTALRAGISLVRP